MSMITIVLIAVFIYLEVSSKRASKSTNTSYN